MNRSIRRRLDREKRKIIARLEPLIGGTPHQGRSRPGARVSQQTPARRRHLDFEYKPHRAKKSYRIIVLRKRIVEERGQRILAEDFRYFFYITNDRSLPQDEVIAESNGRCNQENLIEQLKNGVRELHAPVKTLNANWAYMVIAALARSLKVWFGLLVPISPRWRDVHEAERDTVVRMDFRSILQRFVLIPAQVVRTGRRLVYRLLAWRPDLAVFFRLLDALRSAPADGRPPLTFAFVTI